MTDAIVIQANTVYRDYATDGVPSSGPNAPAKSDIRALWSALAGILDGLSGAGGGSGYIGFTTLALLNADLGHPAGTIGEVLADSTGPNNGVYLKSGPSGSGSWTQITTLTLSGLNAAIAAETSRATGAEAAEASARASADSAEAAARASADALLTTNLAATTSGVAGLNAAVAENATDEPDRAAPRLVYDATTGAAALDADNEIHVYIVMGQSNAFSAVDTSAPVASSPLFLEKVWMPATGVHVNWSSTAGFLSVPFNDLAPLVEITSGSVGETMCSGFANHLYNRLATLFPTARLPHICTFVSAVGGTNYYQLKRGSPAYDAALAAMVDIVRIAEKRGLTVILKGVIYNQGENDVYDATRAAFAAWMRQLQRDIADDFPRITGQRHRPKLYLVQTNRVVYACGPWQEVQIGQIEAAASPDIKLVGPMYSFPMSTNSTADSLVHHNNIGQNRIGQMVARAVYCEEYAQGWTPVQPFEVYFYSPTTIIIACSAQTFPLVLDTAGDVSVSGMLTKYGFSIFTENWTKAVDILSVAVTNFGSVVTGNAIALTLSAPPEADNVIVAYAMQRDNSNDSTTADGPATGARGCIRDSTVDLSLYDSHPGYNWMVAWSRRIPTLRGKTGARNRLRNATFAINQRAVSGTVTLTAGQYGHDGVKGGASGATYTFSTTGVDTTLTISAGSLIMPVEAALIEGGYYTLSHDGTAQARVWQGAGYTGSGSYAAAPGWSGLNTASLTAATQTNAEFSTGTVIRPQLEPGLSATAFDRRPLTDDLQLCYRYLWVLSGATNAFQFSGYEAAGNALNFLLAFPTTMASAPTATKSGTFTTTNTTGLSFATQAQFATVSLTATAAGHALSSNSTAATLNFSAEI